MGALVVGLLLVILLAGAGFAMHALWIIAALIGVVWLLGFVYRGADNARWYRW